MKNKSNMGPYFSNSYISDCNRGHSKFFRKLYKLSSVVLNIWKASDVKNLLVSKFRSPMLFTKTLSEESKRMNIILRKGYIFKIFKAVISFNSVLMVYAHSIGCFSKKCFADKTMNRSIKSFLVYVENMKQITRRSLVAIKDHSFFCKPLVRIWKFSTSKPSEITYFIKSIRIGNFFPVFHVCLLMVICILSYSSQNVYANVVSVDNVFVANDVYSADFPTKLNRDIQQLTAGVNNIESVNVASDSLKESNFADEINPRIRTHESAVCSNFVYSGLLPATGASLTTNITAGTGYPLGYRVYKASNTAHTYTASKWTWTDLDTNGDFHYTETAFGAAAPAVYANSMRLAMVSSDAATVNYVLDLRTTSCTTGPFSLISDATGESSLGDLLQYGDGGFQQGLELVSKDATTVYVNAGSAYINGQYRTLTTPLSVPIDSVGSSTAGTSGLDVGAVAASTTYFMYAGADIDAVKPMVGILSLNPTTPGGVTNFRKLGEVTTDASSSIASADVVSIHYLGSVVQVKKFQTGEVKTGTTAFPLDDTIPQNTEGDQYLICPFTPTSATNSVKVDVTMALSHSANTIYMASLFMGTNPNAISTAAIRSPGVNQTMNLKWTTFVPIIGSTSTLNFAVRAGGAAGATTTMNGETGARLFGGTMLSSIDITEYRK